MKNRYIFLIVIFVIQFISYKCTKNNENSSDNNLITEVGIQSVSEEVMPVYNPLDNKQASTKSTIGVNSKAPSNDQIGYSISYGDEVNIQREKVAEIARPLKPNWRYRLIAYDATGEQAGLLSYAKGNTDNEAQTMTLKVGEPYTFVCYAQYNMSANDGVIALPTPSTTNINTATINPSGGAAFMYWTETVTVHHGLKLNINLRHKFHGLQVTIKAPTGYSFRVIDHLNNAGYGVRIYPVLGVTTVNIKDGEITAASNNDGFNPELANTFVPIIPAGSYAAPYNKYGRRIYFRNPNNLAENLPNATTQNNAIYFNSLSCDETASLIIRDPSSDGVAPLPTQSNYQLFATYKSLIKIHQFQLRRDSDGAETSVQKLIISNLDLKRHKMNRITINLIPPASLL